MTDLQAWVNRKYSTKEAKEDVEELYLSEPTLEGQLDLSEFTSLYQILLSNSLDRTRITFFNQPKSLAISTCKVAQQVFDLEYPVNGLCLGNYDNWEVKNKSLSRSEIRNIELADANLEGPLVLADFPNLSTLSCSYNQLTSLTLINCPQLQKVLCFDNQLSQLPTGLNPIELRLLDITSNQLTDTLDLSCFLNLEVFYCRGNQITELKLAPDPHLIKLDCSHNQLTDLDAVSQSVNLVKSLINHNQFSGSLAPLAKLINLQTLDLSHNRLTGSLAPLQSLTSLKWLHITDTKLKTGLESLPASLIKLDCDEQQFLALEPYRNPSTNYQYKYNYSAWRDHNQELIQILLASDQLAIIQANLQNFFTKNKDFPSQYQQLSSTQQQIQYTTYAHYLATVLTAGGSILGGYQGISGGYLAGSAGLVGMAISYATNEKLKSKVQAIEKRWGNTENLREEATDKFIMAVVQLEINHRELLKILTDLSTLSANPTKAEGLNKSFTKFLEAVATLRKSTQQSLADNDHLELGWRTEIAIKFMSTFQKDWKGLSTVITNLIQEANNHREQMHNLGASEESNLVQSTQ